MQRLLTIFTLALIGAFSWQLYRFYRETFPNTAVLRKQYPVAIYRGPELPFDVEIQKKKPGYWTPLKDIPRVVQGAVLVSEDWAFFEHKGYDPNQIKEAISQDLSRGKFARGASTITQQVVKNVFLERDKTLWRKVKEFILAVRLEKSLSKYRILEIYFNIVEWGEDVFGIQAAARTYFNKTPSQLTAKEGAFLAMLLPSPKRYSQSFRAKRLTPYADKTVRNILRNMARAGYLTPEERVAMTEVPLPFESRAALTSSSPPMEPEPDPDEVRDEVPTSSEPVLLEDPDSKQDTDVDPQP